MARSISSQVLRANRQFQSDLNKWVKRTQSKVIRQAVTRAATPVLAAARQRAPEDTGMLKQSLSAKNGRKIVTYKNNGVVQAIIGPGRIYATFSQVRSQARPNQPAGEVEFTRGPAHYAHLVEYGFLNARDGTFVPPQPFLRPAMDATRGVALKIFTESCRRGMEREAAKR